MKFFEVVGEFSNVANLEDQDGNVTIPAEEKIGSAL